MQFLWRLRDLSAGESIYFMPSFYPLLNVYYEFHATPTTDNESMTSSSALSCMRASPHPVVMLPYTLFSSLPSESSAKSSDEMNRIGVPSLPGQPTTLKVLTLKKTGLERVIDLKRALGNEPLTDKTNRLPGYQTHDLHLKPLDSCFSTEKLISTDHLMSVVSSTQTFNNPIVSLAYLPGEGPSTCEMLVWLLFLYLQLPPPALPHSL